MEECSFKYPDSYPLYVSRVTTAIYAIYCPVIITINIVLIVSFVATKQCTKNTSNLLIVCLSLSDCLIGATVIPTLIMESVWFDSKRLCPVFYASFPLQYLFVGMSFFMTLLLAIDRYLHMNPNILENNSKIAKLFKRPQIYFLIFACFVFLMAMSLSLYFLMKINPKITGYFNALCAIALLVILPIFVTMYTRSYLRIRRFVAENPVYQNSGESGSNESPEYLKELFKTVLILIIATVISDFSFIAVNFTATILSFMNHSKATSTEYKILAHTGYILLFANTFINASIILYRNKKSTEWLKKCLSSCCRHRKREEEPRTSEVIVNVGVEETPF